MEATIIDFQKWKQWTNPFVERIDETERNTLENQAQYYQL